MIVLVLLFILQISLVDAVDANTQVTLGSSPSNSQDTNPKQPDISNKATPSEKTDINSSQNATPKSSSTIANQNTQAKPANTARTRKKRSKTKKQKDTKNKERNDINLIINKCNLLIKLIKKTNKSANTEPFEKIRDLFSKNKTELNILYMGNAQQRLDKLNQYLDKISKLATDLTQQCPTEAMLQKEDSDTKITVQNKTLAEIKEQYKNVKLQEPKKKKKSKNAR